MTTSVPPFEPVERELDAPGAEPAGTQASHASLTQQLAELVLSRPIVREDRRAAAGLVLDAIANALAARVSEPGHAIRAWYRALDPTFARPRDPGREAFVMGALAHSLEVDDLHRASVTHPGCVVVPAAWVAARAAGVDGRTFLHGVIRGYEVMCRIGIGLGPRHYKFWHKTATAGPFGAAAAVGSILGLDEAQMTDALGNAGTQAAGLWEFLDSGGMAKHLHAGRAAEAGWLAASLAGYDFTGPDRILEGSRGVFAAMCPDADAQAVLRDPEGFWQIHNTSLKPWPSCRHTHAPIDAAMELFALLRARGAHASDIGAVHVRTYGTALDICDRISPKSDYEAKFSLQHCVAAALGQGAVDFASFDEEARVRLAPVRARVTLVPEDRFERAYPDAWGATVCVTLRDGTQIDATRTMAKGDPEAPLSPQEIADKAFMLMGHSDTAEAESLVEILQYIDSAPYLPDLGGYWLEELG